MISRLLLSTALALWSFSMPTIADDQSALCDQLAASPFDATRPAGIAGVPHGDIVVAEAEAECRLAWDADALPRMGYQLARVLYQDGRIEEALTLFEAAAAGGHVEAKVGQGLALIDIAHAKAVELNKEAAEAGSMNAVFNLAVFARDNDQNGAEAVALFDQAAAQGDAEAAYNIAVIYDEGKLLLRDAGQAKHYYEQAVDGNFSWAKINLGYLLLEGSVDAAERQRALELFRSAAKDDGDINAGLQLGIMLQSGSVAEQEESEALVLAALKARDRELARFLQQDDIGLSERNLGALYAELSATSIDQALAKLPAYYAAQQ